MYKQKKNNIYFLKTIYEIKNINRQNQRNDQSFISYDGTGIKLKFKCFVVVGSCSIMAQAAHAIPALDLI